MTPGNDNSLENIYIIPLTISICYFNFVRKRQHVVSMLVKQSTCSQNNVIKGIQYWSSRAPLEPLEKLFECTEETETITSIGKYIEGGQDKAPGGKENIS